MTCRRWRRSVRRSWTSASEAGCRGATWATSTWAWPRTGEAMLSAPRPQLRNAVELEPPGAFAGQSAALLARHLAYYGRADEVMELFESARSKLPSLDRVNGIGSWSCLLNFVEAFYLCGLNEQAAALSPLVEGVLELDERWISLRRPASGDPCRSRRRSGSSLGGSRTPLRHRPRGRRADAQSARACRPGPPTRPDAAGSRRPGDDERAAEMLQEALSAYRTFGMPAYAAEAERLQRQAQGFSVSVTLRQSSARRLTP